MKTIALAALALALAGCAALGPVSVTCKGKGTLSFQGGPYAGMIAGDCGDGFEFRRDAPTQGPAM